MSTEPTLANNMLKKYIPVGGAICHGLLGCTYANPSLLPRASNQMSLGLFACSGLGLCSYAYSRKHMAGKPQAKRLLHAMYGSAVLSASSMVMFSLIRMSTECKALRLILALLGSALILGIGKDYVDSVDAVVPDIESPP